jgi:hypothetical protein
MLSGVARSISALAQLPPGTPLASRKVYDLVQRADVGMERLLEYKEATLIPLFTGAFVSLRLALASLSLAIYDAVGVCGKMRKSRVPASFDPCIAHTLDSDLDRFAKQIGAMARYAGIETVIEKASSDFMEELRHFSRACSSATGMECLRLVKPETAVPASFRLHMADLASATELLTAKFMESYGNLKEWKVGAVLLGEHLMSDKKLLELAEYMAGIAYILIKGGYKPLGVNESSVFSLKNMITAKFSNIADVLIKPAWTIEFHTSRVADPERTKTLIATLKRMLAERGFKVEHTDYGFKVTIPPGDIREAVKIICMTLPAFMVEDPETSYTLSLEILGKIDATLEKLKLPKKPKPSL